MAEPKLNLMSYLNQEHTKTLWWRQKYKIGPPLDGASSGDEDQVYTHQTLQS